MRQISLRQRALEALSRREFSRLELQRKLAPHAGDPDALEQLLDTLQQQKLLSDQRFADSLTHRRSEKFGVRRILAELAQHGLSDEITEAQANLLKLNEIDRCEQVWAKKFGVSPQDAFERAKQMRFLAGRGFDGETIAAVLRRAASKMTAA